MRKGVFLILIMLLYCFEAFNQSISYTGIFPTIDHSGILSAKWLYNSYNFAAIKPFNKANNKSRILYLYTENGLSYHLSRYLTITNSYVYERQEPFESNARNEHRFFQQFTYNNAIANNIEIKIRTRFDERFIQDILTKDYNFYSRIRALVGSKYNFNENMYAFAYSEYFFNTSKGGNFKFNENWSALQLGLNLNKKNSIEFGYLYVGWIYNQNNDWLHQHYFQTTWVNKLSFSGLENKRKQEN